VSVAGARRAAGLLGVLALVAFLALILLGSLKWRPPNDAARVLTKWWVTGWGWFGTHLPGAAAQVSAYSWLPLLLALAAGGLVGFVLRKRPNAWVYAGVLAGLTGLFLYVPAAGIRLAALAVWAGTQFDHFRAGML